MPFALRRMQNEAKTKTTAVLCDVAVKTHNSNFLRKKSVIRNLYGNAPVSERGFSQYTLQFQNVALPDTLCIEAHVK